MAEAEQGAGAGCGAGGSGGEETQTETMHKRNLPRELCQEDLSLSLSFGDMNYVACLMPRALFTAQCHCYIPRTMPGARARRCN